MFSLQVRAYLPVIITICSAIAGIGGSNCQSQNFVPNPSFELLTSIPNGNGQWYKCQNWSSVNNFPAFVWPYASPDYFHTSGFAPASLPNTGFGLVPMPLQGNALMGHCLWLGGSLDFREYLNIQLSSPLVAGMTYKVQFKISSGLTGCGWSVGSYGVYFSNGLPVQIFHEPIQKTPQWTYAGQLQSPNWTQVTFHYTPDSTKTHMTLGNFKTDAQTNFVPFRAGSPWAYYFVDDFSVVEDPELFVDGDSVICVGDSVHLIAKNDTVIKWTEISNPNVVLTTDSVLDTFLTQTTVFVVYAKQDTDTFTVFVIQYPVVNLGSDTTLCLGQGLILNPVSGNYTYLWNNGSTNPNFPVPPNANGTYSVTVTQQICSASDTIVITYAPIPIVDLGPDTTLCPGDSVLLNAAYKSSAYVWQDGSTDSTYLAKQAGLYFVTVADSFCADTDSVVVSFYPANLLNLGPDTSICPGDKVTFNAGGGFAFYLWQDGSNDSSFTTDSAGMYILSVAGAGNCMYSDTVNVYMNAAPVVNFGPDTIICIGQKLILNAGNAGSGFSWQDNSMAQTFAVTQDGLYWVTVTNPAGCKASDTIQVWVYWPLTDLGPDFEMCEGEQVELDATEPGATYLWHDGSTGPKIIADAPGTYQVQVTASNCTASDEVTVTMKYFPVAMLGVDTSLCQGETFLLDAGDEGTRFSWNLPVNTRQVEIRESGNYFVEITNECGADQDTIAVEFSNCACNVWMPNAFSPNGDGRNDEIKPVFDCDISEYSFLVFNRWGEIVFSSSDQASAWNGGSGHNAAPEGAYVYHIRYEGSGENGIFVKDELKGSLSLLR